MNIIMKIWKRKSLEEEYNDLSNFCVNVSNHFHGEDYESIIRLCGRPNYVMLLEKEDLFLRIKKKKNVERILMEIVNLIGKTTMSIGGFLQALIPKDEFDGRYSK